MGMVLCYKNDMVMKAIMMMIFTILVDVDNNEYDNDDNNNYFHCHYDGDNNSQ